MLFADEHASAGVGWCAYVTLICKRRGRGLRAMNGKMEKWKRPWGGNRSEARKGRMDGRKERDRSREEDRFKYLP